MDTLKLIGKQSILPVLKATNDIRLIRQKPQSAEDAMVDIYLLGYINGKRAERARRKTRE